MGRVGELLFAEEARHLLVEGMLPVREASLLLSLLGDRLHGNVSIGLYYLKRIHYECQHYPFINSRPALLIHEGYCPHNLYGIALLTHEETSTLIVSAPTAELSQHVKNTHP